MDHSIMFRDVIIEIYLKWLFSADIVLACFVFSEHGFVGYSEELLWTNTLPDYTAGENFFTVFGVFFPAATGDHLWLEKCAKDFINYRVTSYLRFVIMVKLSVKRCLFVFYFTESLVSVLYNGQQVICHRTFRFLCNMTSSVCRREQTEAGAERPVKITCLVGVL